MPRHSRLSVLLVRAPTLRLTTVFTELPALSRTERRRLAEATRAAAAAYKESSDEENIWEDEGAEEQSAEDGACSAAGAEQPQPEQVEEELEPVCDAAAAASVEEGQAGKGDEGAEGDEEAAGAGDECDEEGADGCGDENMAPAPAPAEETEEGSSNTGVAVIDDDTAGAVDAPAPALGGGQDLARVKVLLQQLLLLGAESEAAVADVHDTAACTLDAVAELRQEMGERFMALERTLFAVCHHLDITELPPTQRSITFRGKECAGQAPDGPAAAAAACTGANCEGKAGPPAAEQRQALQPIDVNVAAAAAQSVPRLGARRGARR